jgi:hypothetical protein
MNPIQIARGIEKTAIALVSELRSMSREVSYILSSIFFLLIFVIRNSWLNIWTILNRNRNYLVSFLQPSSREFEVLPLMVILVMDFAYCYFPLVVGKSR